MRQTDDVCLLGAGPGDPELIAFEALRAPARAPAEGRGVNDGGVAAKHLARADAIGALVCRMGMIAAVLLVVALAARG